MRPRGSRKGTVSVPPTRYARMASASKVALDLEKARPGAGAVTAGDTEPLAVLEPLASEAAEGSLTAGLEKRLAQLVGASLGGGLTGADSAQAVEVAPLEILLASAACFLISAAPDALDMVLGTAGITGTAGMAGRSTVAGAASPVVAPDRTGRPACGVGGPDFG